MVIYVAKDGDMEEKTIKERLDKLESHLVILGKRLDGVRCIPVIDLPEKAKRPLTEEELIAREGEPNRMWKNYLKIRIG